MTEDRPQQAEELDQKEKVFFPERYSRFQVEGDSHGVQADTIHGNQTWNYTELFVEAKPWDRVLSRDEMADGTPFIEPGGYEDARRLLSRTGVMALRGEGSGREFAAKRLLAEYRPRVVVELDPHRTLTVEPRFEQGHAYLWELCAVNGHSALSEPGFRRLASAVRAKGGLLILIPDDAFYLPSELDSTQVRLSPPAAMDVFSAIVGHRDACRAEEIISLAKENEEDLLRPGTSPGRAVQVADALMAAGADPIRIRETLDSFRGHRNATVERWFSVERTPMEISMAIAVAFFENRAMDPVYDLARSLLEAINKAQQSIDGVPPATIPIFETSRSGLLRRIEARGDIIEHPRHPGLQDETVRFLSSERGAAILTYVWRHYDRVRPVLLDWMSAPNFPTEFRLACVNALCLVTKDVPAHRPLDRIRSLASHQRLSSRELAAQALRRLARNPQLTEMVETLVDDWVHNDTKVMVRTTAALMLSTSYGKENLPKSLQRLARLAQAPNPQLRNNVVRSLLVLLADEKSRSAVLTALSRWTDPAVNRAGQQQVAFATFLWALGFNPQDDRILLTGPPPDVDASRTAQQTESLTATLLTRLVHDPSVFGDEAISQISTLAGGHEIHEARLCRMMRLVLPDSRWWPRTKFRWAYVTRFPQRGLQMARILQAYGRADRRG
ncbi:hypothetical protein [Actinoalloteichus hymeniacidonis]|nr:hypothetical protein [Actinoalloteichus hymeniacidonis]MBB5906966.1 hypothetical protein [Actinoalloteichus hymeniacidonis]